MASIGLKSSQIFFALTGCDIFGNIFFEQQKILQHQGIHVSRKKTTQRFGRSADNWLASHVETGIHQRRTPGLILECFQQAIKSSVPCGVHRLQARAVIDMRDRGKS